MTQHVEKMLFPYLLKLKCKPGEQISAQKKDKNKIFWCQLGNLYSAAVDFSTFTDLLNLKHIFINFSHK